MPYYNPPKIYRVTQERRRRDALAAVARQASGGQRAVADAIAVNGERMSDEGRALLEGLSKTLGEVGRVMGGRGR